MWWLTHIQPGQTVIDVGANVGDMTVLLAAVVGSYGHVYAIEPGPRLFQTLCGNTQHLTQVQCHRFAASDTRDQRNVVHYIDWTLLDVADPRAASWREVAHPGQDLSLKEQFTATFMPLDEFCLEYVRHPVSAIKIDVDGGEGFVILGAQDTLRRDHPILMVEFGEMTMARVYCHPRSILDYLSALGYRFYNNDIKAEYAIEELISAIPADGTLDVVCLAE